MKTSTLFKSIATVALGLMIGSSVFGQISASLPAAKSISVAADIETTSPELVSKGALMPYTVTPDATIAAATTLFSPSVFKWTAVQGGTSLTLKLANGTTNLTGWAATGAPAGYFSENTVYLTMPSTVTDLTDATTTAATQVVLGVKERSVPIFDPLLGCEDAGKTLAINVVNLPGLPSAITDMGGCGGSASYTLAYDFSTVTTHYPYYVELSIGHTDLAGASDATAVTYFYKIASASDKIILAKADLTAVKNTAGELTNGKYTVGIVNAWDQVSVKALNRTSIAVAATLSSGIVVLPTPATGDIKHLKVLE